MNDLVNWLVQALGKLTFRSSLNEFYEELAENLHMNIGVAHFLQIRHDLAVKRGRAPEASVFRVMIQRIEQGGALSSAVQGMVPENNLIMIQAGEYVAKVVEGVESALLANKSLQRMRGIMVETLFTPIILIIALAGLMTLFGTRVIPQFLFVVPIERMGGAYRLTYSIVQTVASYWWAVALLGAALVAIIVWSIANVSGALRKWLDHIPPYSIVRQYVSAAMLVNISGLLRSNVTMQDAIDLLTRNASSYQRRHLAVMQQRFNSGFSLSTAMDTGLFPNEIIDRLVTYERAGSDKLDLIMRRIGFENFEKSLKLVTRDVQAVAMSIKIAVGAMLGWLVYDTFTIGQIVNAMVRSVGG